MKSLKHHSFSLTSNRLADRSFFFFSSALLLIVSYYLIFVYLYGKIINKLVEDESLTKHNKK